MEDLRATFLTLDTSLISNAIPYLINLLLTTTIYVSIFYSYSHLLRSQKQSKKRLYHDDDELRAKKEIMWVQSEAAVIPLQAASI